MVGVVQAGGLQELAIRRESLTPFGLGWPNVISAGRVALVPFLAWLILARTRTAALLAAALFVVGAATDGVDGYLARRYRAVTRTGQWLDPLADKALVATPVVILTALGRFPIWAAVAIVLREVAIAALRIVLGTRGIGLPASRGAKLKTVTQLGAIALYILPMGARAHGPRLGLLLVAVALTLVTGFDYLWRAARWVRAPGPVGSGAPR